MAAGREHAVVATSDGKVFTWGGRDLLTGRKGNTREPGQALVRGREGRVDHVQPGPNCVVERSGGHKRSGPLHHLGLQIAEEVEAAEAP